MYTMEQLRSVYAFQREFGLNNILLRVILFVGKSKNIRIQDLREVGLLHENQDSLRDISYKYKEFLVSIDSNERGKLVILTPKGEDLFQQILPDKLMLNRHYVFLQIEKTHRICLDNSINPRLMLAILYLGCNPDSKVKDLRNYGLLTQKQDHLAVISPNYSLFFTSRPGKSKAGRIIELTIKGLDVFKQIESA